MPTAADMDNGVVTGVAPGKTFVRANAGGKSDSTAVTVVSTGPAQ
jgi:hypothetical protein